MKFSACQFSLSLLAVCAAPAALAGPDILKCVDRSGHVTLTDQPCPAGSRVSLVIPDAGPGAAVTTPPGGAQVGSSGNAGATGSGGDEPLPATAAPAVEHYPLPPPPPRSKVRPAPAKRTPMTRDEVTLKAARMKMLINDDLTRQAGAQ